MKKIAIVLGASGLTGNLVLENLLKDENYQEIKLFSRKAMPLKNPKVTEYLGDITQLKTFEKDFNAHEVYCCIGTTAKKTPDQDLYHQIDFGIPVEAAKLCKKNKIDTFLVVSAIGANAKSSIFYNRTKGEMEQAVLEQNIPNTYILRPSLIIGKRNETRFAEKIALYLFKFFNPLFFGKYKKYRAIEASAIAKSMIKLANEKPKIKILESNEIYNWAVK